MNTDDAKQIAQELVAEGNRLGLTWTMRPGKVSHIIDETVYVVVDGDGESPVPIPMTSLIVRPHADERVYTVQVPPAGNYIIGRRAPVIGITTGTPDANGYLVVTHGLPFTPYAIFCQNGEPDSGVAIFAQFVLDSLGINDTTFRVRCFTQTGTTITSVAVTLYWIAYP